MRIRGALHVHSTLSHDGTLTIAELAHFYRERRFHFVALGEHSQDLDESKVQQMVAECTAHSRPDLCLIPGIEFTCSPPTMHLFAPGCVELTAARDPLVVARHIREQGCLSVLAHPKRLQWNCSPDLLRCLDAVEIWNVGYDGKLAPAGPSLAAFRGMQQINPDLLAVASHDLHHKGAFYNVGIEMETGALTRQEVLDRLRRGDYRIESLLFRTDSRAATSRAREWYLRAVAQPIRVLRHLRHLFQRYSP